MYAREADQSDTHDAVHRQMQLTTVCCRDHSHIFKFLKEVLIARMCIRFKLCIND